MNTYEEKVKQMEWLSVKESEKKMPAKRVNIVSKWFVKKASCIQNGR